MPEGDTALSHKTVTTTWTGPTAVGARALGPDLARGLMLLSIALANSHYFLRGTSVVGGFPQSGSSIDSAVAWGLATFVDGRAWPMFALLFGYGVAQLVRRNEQAGRRFVRGLLRRRGFVLVVIGIPHGLLFYVGDILATYGVVLLVAAWAVFWSDRWLLLAAVLFFVLTSMPSGDSLSVSTDSPGPAMLPPDLFTMFSDRIGVVVVIALFGPLGFACPFLVGLWAGRRRILEQPEHHRRLLWGTAVAGIGSAIVGAQPAALTVAGVRPLAEPAVRDLIGTMHDVAGVMGGLGYAAIIALLAHRIAATRRGPVTVAIVATGQRSMTSYLTQSVVWFVVFTPFLLDLSGALTVSATALLAAGTWLGTVLLADRMRRHGLRGPFEYLIRQLTYRNAQARPTSSSSPP